MSVLPNQREPKDRLPGQLALEPPHALTADQVLERLQTSHRGLTLTKARSRLERFGPNSVPRARPAGLLRVFLRQFLNPLIYCSPPPQCPRLLEEWSDAAFIFGVLLINAVIGTAQEHSAERSASALQVHGVSESGEEPVETVMSLGGATPVTVAAKLDPTTAITAPLT